MPDTNINEQAFDEFITQLIRGKGLEEEDKKQGGKLRAELSLQVEDKVQDAILGALSEEQAIELEKLIDAEADDEQMEKFFKDTGIDFSKAAVEALEKFRAEYLGMGDGTNMTSYNNSDNAAQGQPMQGAISEMPGESDVEGVAQDTTVTAEEV